MSAGRLLPGQCRRRRPEDLPRDAQAVGSSDRDRLRFHERRGREVGGQRRRGEVACRRAAGEDGRLARAAGIAADERHRRAIGQHRGVPLEATTGCQCHRWRRTRRRDAPQVTSIDVVLVGAHDRRASVGCVAHVVHFEGARCQEHRLAAGGSHRVEMLPAVALPWEHQPLVGGPRQLRAELDRLEHAAASGRGVPYLAAGAGGDLGHADRPRVAFALGVEDHAVAHRRPADERDARAVGRPHRPVVGVERGLQPGERLGRDVDDADQGVGAARADERQPRSIGRPGQRPGRSARAHGLSGRGHARQAGEPDLAALHEGHTVALGRQRRTTADAELARRAAGNRHGPDGLLGAGRVAGGIGNLPGAIRAATADVDQRRAVGRKRRVGDLLAVVALIGRESPAGERRALGHPKVPSAALVEHPGDAGAGRRGDDLARKRGAEDLLDRERPTLSRGEIRSRRQRPREHRERQTDEREVTRTGGAAHGQCLLVRLASRRH